MSHAVSKLAIGLVAAAATASASFSADCRNICLGKDAANFLVTECTVDGGTTDTNYQWSQIDLNQLLGYQSPNIVYQQNGDFSISNAPCGSCGISGAQLTCSCDGSNAGINLDTYIDDVTGSLCFANDDFGPICGTSTSRTC